MTQTSDRKNKAALLRAGAEIANLNGGDVTAITVDAVSKAAGLKRKDFRGHFKDRKTFLRELLLNLFDETRADVLQAGQTEPKPGHERVWKCLEAYLDGNLRRSGMRRLVLALAADQDAMEMVRRRAKGYGMVIKLELDAMVVPHAAARGRFLAVMAQDAAQAEYEAGKVMSDVRAALYSFVRSL